jgi:hypothetical protein
MPETTQRLSLTLILGWGFAVLATGFMLGLMLADWGRHCETHTSDGGLTLVEVCTKDVSP